MDGGVPERSMSSDAALRRARDEVGRLGLTADVEWLGSARVPVPVVQLRRDGCLVASGSGKGTAERSLASAWYEALESFYMSWRGSRRLAPGATELMTAAAVAGQPALTGDLVVRRWAADFPGAVAACAPMDGPRGPVWYPVFLSDPGYHDRPLPGDSVAPYRSLLRYSSSIGTAAGATPGEATLHAIGELIEHDALSHAMLRWFVAGDTAPRLVDPTGLPPHLRRLHDAAAVAAGAGVHLIDLTTDLGVPVYLAIAHRDESGPPVFGTGASLHGTHAAERALRELMQMTAADPAAALAALASLAPWPLLAECARLPVRSLLTSADRVSLRDGAPPDGRDPNGAPTPVADDGRVEARPDGGEPAAGDRIASATGRLSRLLAAHGIDVYLSELTPPESTIGVVTAVAPGLERFSLVYLGLPIVPTGRGWDLWTGAMARRRSL
ncbi:YcaO-like family protein [Rugosimonospora africana]|uniref:YcaO-like family protein n=1 Tax=Rugosimonospora africana TaxID=556532 RepID=UPI00194556DF|nr:YcaO-like family protein [Rugosimonospora africana]